MDIYGDFAQVYDRFIDAPYDEWAAYIKRIWEKFNLAPKLVCDLGCGTGSITCRLAALGYDTIGIDLSADMLAIARQKDQKTLYLQQDMRSFELYGTVDACICMVDSINYILCEDELSEVFGLVHNYLHPGGLFIFDINTLHKFKHVLGDNSFCDIDDETAIIWENYYDEDTKINEYFVNIFMPASDGLYERYEETHRQRAYEAEFISEKLMSAGFELLGVYDALSFDAPNEKSEKIFFVAKKLPRK